MSEYRPGDIEVRSAYIERQWNAAAILSDVSGPWFDRWLAAHDEQVRAAERERMRKEIERQIRPNKHGQGVIGLRNQGLRDALDVLDQATVPAEQKESK